MDLLRLNEYVNSVSITHINNSKLPHGMDSMLYKSYNVLNACELFSGNYNDYRHYTYFLPHKLTREDLESFGIYMPDFNVDYDCYITKMNNIICIYAHASFDLTGYNMNTDVKDLFPLARGKDLQSLYEFTYDRATQRLHVVIAQYCLMAPAITSYLIDWGIMDVSPALFRDVHAVIMEAAQSRFKCETAADFCFEEVD